MKNYSVEITQTVYRSVEFKVQALDEEDAKEEAYDQLRALRKEQATVDWHEKVADSNTYATEIKEAKVATD